MAAHQRSSHKLSLVSAAVFIRPATSSGSLPLAPGITGFKWRLLHTGIEHNYRQ